ncbi:MAG TPA: homoserine dehydrogenase [Anaeromyxobacter sp.]|nr:homoserine dehydrogenase [Anaeromyxobacter sp.]
MSDRPNAIRIGILGLGNIGTGTVEILQRNAAHIERRLGAPIVLARAADLDPSRAAKLNLPPGVFTTDARAVVDDPSIQILVELIGGIEPARTFILVAMERGKHVVTANKALLAAHWGELVTRAEERRINFGFEGSVGGGIPIIHVIRRGLVGNRIRRVTGIINGTCNYILTRMAREHRPFAEILADAQAHGFAEANPALDVDGIDAAQKLTILVNLCFGLSIGPDALTRHGIREVTPLDLSTAEELGYRMKLLGSTVSEKGQVEAWVHPALVPISHPLASVEGVFNALYLEDDNLGPSLYFGRGAGPLPTGSAIVADVVSAARDILSGAVSRMPASGERIRGQEPGVLSPAGEARSEFYLRVMALDRPGVLSAVTGVLGRQGVSIASVIQRGRGEGTEEAVPVLIVTHDATFAQMSAALSQLDALPVVRPGSFLARMIPETARV